MQRANLKEELVFGEDKPAIKLMFEAEHTPLIINKEKRGCAVLTLPLYLWRISDSNR